MTALTKPNLDFAEMYERCGVEGGGDILRALTEMTPADRQRAEAIIEEMEEEGRRTLELLPGAKELVQWCQAHKLPMGVVTRNTKKTTLILQQLLVGDNKGDDIVSSLFDRMIARDDPSDLPPKPDPAALYNICETLGVECNESVLMVGDSPANDVAFGKAAGASTALLDTGRRYSETQAGKEQRSTPDIVVDDLCGLARQCWIDFTIDGDLGTNQPLLKFETPQAQSQLARAAVSGDLETFSSMNELNEVDESENTPLIWAADAGQTEVVEFLVKQKGVNLDVRGYLGATAVCRAARKGHLDCLNILIKHGANPDIPNIKMQYPLHFAAFKEHPDAVEALLVGGANPRVLDRKGRTPAQDTKNVAIRDRLLQAIL